MLKQSYAGTCTVGSNCAICSTNITCALCLPGAGVDANGDCVPCNAGWHCIYCNGIIPTQCLQCDQYFTVAPDSTCTRITPCVNPDCIHCPTSLLVC